MYAAAAGEKEALVKTTVNKTMIKFQFRKVPIDSDGKAYDSLEAFQASEIVKLCGVSDEAAKAIVLDKDTVIEILELTMDARPGARGQKRPRKPKNDGSIQSLGGHARDAALSEERKSEIAKSAANARWSAKENA